MFADALPYLVAIIATAAFAYALRRGHIPEKDILGRWSILRRGERPARFWLWILTGGVILALGWAILLRRAAIV
jgi:hypothetical protein